MKSIFRILVLGVVPILAATAVVDQGLAADKGSQLIFHSNMYHQNYISIANANDGEAVTVLTQYYNDEMAMVLWYLRVIPGGGNVLVDPFDHRIPGTAEQDADGEDIPRSEANVKKVIDNLPPMSFTDEDDAYQDGINSGRFLIVVTAVAGNTVDDADTTDADEGNDASDNEVANILFPDFLAADMHAVDNIDNCGLIATDAARTDQRRLGQRSRAHQERTRRSIRLSEGRSSHGRCRSRCDFQERRCFERGQRRTDRLQPPDRAFHGGAGGDRRGRIRSDRILGRRSCDPAGGY